MAIILSSIIGFSQSNNDMAKAYYLNAEKKYEQQKYDDAIKYLDLSVEMLDNNSFTKIEYLYTQIYYQQNDYKNADIHLQKFFEINSNTQSTMYIELINIAIEIKEEEAKRIELEREIMEASSFLSSQTQQVLSKFQKIKEGRPYLVTYRSSLTTSTNERAIFIYYGNKYIIYTIPSISIAEKLLKSNVSYNSYDANHGGDVIKAKIKPNYGDKRETSFKQSLHFSNVYLGGFGDELLWTSGQQYQVFDKTLYYYYYFNTLSCDIELKTDFQKDYYNPYIETGTLVKTVDYDLINDAELELELKDAGVKHKKSESLSNTNILEIIIKPSNNIKMLYPLKKINYGMKDKISKYTKGGSKYKGTLLYFVPKTETSHYGFVQYGTSFPKRDIMTAVTGLDNTYTVPESYFNSLYNTLSEDVGNGKSRYFTDSNYTTPFFIMQKIMNGNSRSLNTYDSN